jgi:hypothetical protein
MKIIYAILPMAIALCGCDKSSITPRSDEQLESRVSVLEKSLAELRWLNQSNLTAMQNNFLTASATNFQAFDAINHQLVFDNNRIEFMQTVVSNLINTINQQVAVMSQQNNSQVAPTVQIPANVLDQIRAGAIQQFPNNVNRQNDMIKQETDAWRKLNQ